MSQRLFVAALFMGLLQTVAIASGEPISTFVDGRWSGGVEADADSKGLNECWARSTFGDGTSLTLARRGDGSWFLRLSNPDWRLPPAHSYAMVALVDAYPRLRIVAEARSKTRLEIAELEQNSLLGLIENGHTIDLSSDGFNGKYDLEGSAKAIARVRDCSAG